MLLINAREFREVDAVSEQAKPRTKPLSRSQTSPAIVAPAWVNFLKTKAASAAPRLGTVLGLGGSSVMSTPHAAESVARLVLSAMQCADHYFQTAVENR